MQSDEIRKRFLDFFEKRGHAVIPSAPLLPENDPSVLFNTAGMQPIVPYLLGETHPMGKRLVDIQKCVRTNDIKDVGDKSHLTFFEMVGHWSLDDYFKHDAINWMYEFLTNKDTGLGLDPNRLYATVFEGNNDAPLDQEAVDIWQTLISAHRIYPLDAKENWWAAGDNGPCGPDTEYFYDTTEQGLGNLTKEEFLRHCNALDIIEICNSVFMQYLKKDGVVVGPLGQQSVDFGGGLERLTILMQNVDTIYETDLFAYFIDFVEQHSTQTYAGATRDYRIIADHIRAAVFMIADGARPGNKDQGYILRRLLRRAVGRMRTIGFDHGVLIDGVEMIISKYEDVYPNLREQSDVIASEIEGEINKFKDTLEQGLKEFKKMVVTGQTKLDGTDMFTLFTTYGFPLDLITEEADKRSLKTDINGFNTLLQDHQEKSRTAGAGMFKGGLAGDSSKMRALHTSTHLMLAGLRKYLGEGVNQAGSNTTEERIRFDFTNDSKVEQDTLDMVEQFVNDAIAAEAMVTIDEMEKETAKESGVVGSFWEKYPDIVKVYIVTGPDGNVYSRELCGGPHVENTKDIAEFGIFKIKKEESSSAGVRRIKAVLERA